MKLDTFIKCLLDGHHGKFDTLYNVYIWHTATGEILLCHFSLEKIRDMMPMLSYFSVITFEFSDDYVISIEVKPNLKES